MGNTNSETFKQSGTETDLWWANGSEVQTKSNSNPVFTDEISAIRQRRVEVIGAKKKEMDELRKENEELKELLKQRNDNFEVPGGQELCNIGKLKEEKEKLQHQVLELQKHLEEAHVVFKGERDEYKKHVAALKDVIATSKQLVIIRDEENKQLLSKMAEIESTLSKKELEAFSDRIRIEYERQLKNIKQLKILYEQQNRTYRADYKRIKSEFDDISNTLKTEEAKNKELQERVDELEEKNSHNYDSIRSLESQLGLSKAECSELRAEMAVINQLFSQILLGFNNGLEVDLDNLIKLLEENHDLLKDIVVNEECSGMSSALPKVLLDLIHQVNEKDKFVNNSKTDETEVQSSSQQNTISSAAEIVENLPKVWRVLIELLSHQTAFKNENNEEFDKNPCYKSVETPTGPTLVLSVSKTFIRLKDLIVEKKSLEKETTRLKQLNTHLEVRLQDHEKRLEKVSHELASTWHVVGKMQKQHQQLHTHEQILRYELSQKRKLLNGLKEELEYCKEKCLLAHAKNSSTEELWKQLRSEFTARRAAIINEDVNNSMESGYSDDRESSSDDDDDVAENPTILDVIKDEIVKIECQTGKTDAIKDSSTRAQTSETSSLSHSDLEMSSPVKEHPTDKCSDISDIYKKLEYDVLQTIKQTQCGEVGATDQGTSTSNNSEILEQSIGSTRTPEEILAGREDRLRWLEEQAQQLVKKVIKNANRGTEFCKTLNKLHDKYGSISENTENSLERNESANEVSEDNPISQLGTEQP